jgi:predicted O-methyltransferase YrrM
MTILNDPNLERLLDRLHELSDAQTPAIREYRAERDKALDRAPEEQAALTKAFLADKIYALDRDKAEFCYQICRTIDARRVVEIGTSYGVSTLYLAAAVRDNIRAGGGSGVVIGTEYEPEKARAAQPPASPLVTQVTGRLNIWVGAAQAVEEQRDRQRRLDGPP